ncbi:MULTISPECIES: class II fumarate hydratase [unclassified Pseudoalteromonas]|uniref:class II fumarate hydratase n=1 Tax=unclassified Pseudoalteromonas TaxID=194690 RepID=UPI000B760CD1|nr:MULTISPECIES: class II fumarate hydratase [unclassified Pseudoalteromonas]MAJ38781.1 aspartate ammonia-lyase [Pseudoalteromonadaceae bacterium]OUX92848.1 MAG: aspartate ammonia-lyase [Pseudoalteromonas sp. TMED43]MDC9566675.1 class II fumarate hydratase [Pseudoalteromonas sp. GAB2316C]MDC9570919.1 class II fumarate hydratase [Pseudoalteromonas sp. GABNB9D]MDC9575112.1 class II fumarate hydratase [Pseudoalteromonas sp. GABNS16A]|tara:strand:- start:1137 stop:2513 length:1377 start_codon:yes stop_codon:yes gene_type:complete
MSNFRTESDSMGELQVPSDALYQAQTQRAVNNFAISGLTMPKQFVTALAYIKQAAAQSNFELNHLSKSKANAIEQACQQIIDGEHYEHFPVDIFQTGSGTSSNMNANEVIATLATRIGNEPVHPNDDVNMGQSSNDVVPTAIALSSAINVVYELLPSLEKLSQSLEEKKADVGKIVKTGRTHLMDAMPVTFEQTLSAWQSQVNNAASGIRHSLERVCELAQGGTAVGTGINADGEFASKFAKNLSANVGISFKPSSNFFYNIGSQDAIVALSGQLKVLAVAQMKIANDLRWMNSGPLAGLGEIELEALQPGSSIMPGKVNPVIPEAAAMVSAQVIGNDATITVAGQAGNFELNVMLPVIAHNILQSIELLANSAQALADKAIASFKVNQPNIDKALAKNPILVTALNPVIGYEKAAKIAKQAYKEARPIIDVAEQETDLPRSELEKLLNPTKLTQGGL